MPLTDGECRSAKSRDRDYKMSDGGGLYLLVKKNGSKLWRQAYRFDGKQRTLSFGVYPKVTITDARTRRAIAKGRLSRGEDPFEGSGREVRETFREVATEWYNSREANWSKSHSSRLWACLRRDLFPVFGDRAIANVEISDVYRALKLIDERGARETAHRARNYVSQILRYGVSTQRCERDFTVDLRGAIPPAKRSRSHARLKAGEMTDFYGNLLAYDGDSKTADGLDLVVHTFVRTKEIRFAKWSEIDRGDRLWRLPAERMKMSRDHLVPLSDSVLKILDRLESQRDESDFIVPGSRGRPVSENTLLYALYRMGYHSRATVHGFRGLASTVLNESGLFHPDWIEKQLAHEEENQVRAAYNTAEYLKQRTEMMHWWSRWLDDKKSVAQLLS